MNDPHSDEEHRIRLTDPLRAASSADLIRPRALPPAARIAVLAISSPSTPERIDVARARLEAAGHEVALASNLFSRSRSYLAGGDDVRLEEINRFLRSPEYDAFFFARGGYGAMRILDRIDYGAIAADPRPIVGYSDLTALHQAAAVRAGVGTFHGPMLNKDFHDGLSTDTENWMWAMLRGEAPLQLAFDPAQVISLGSATAPLFGGCLSITAALLSTPYDYWLDGGIWFWEDVDEPTYRIDRMLTHLRLSGRLENVRGIMIGKLKECGESDSAELDSLLSEFFGDLGIPVVRNLPFGHHGDNLLLPVGRLVTLDTAACTLTIVEPAVAGLAH